MTNELVPASFSNVPDIYRPRHAAAFVEDEIGDPTREIRFGTVVAVLFFIGFLGWAAFARLDAAAYAEGRLVVSGQRQAVQHRDGGVVGEIVVREGQRVQQGQVLLRLAAAEVRAQERALSSQVISLLAQRARLRAEQFGVARIPAPQEFEELPAEHRSEAAAAMRLQQAQLQARRSVLSAQKGVLGQRSAQSMQQGEGYRRQEGSSGEQLRLINEEIEALRPLAEKGFVSKTRLRAAERAKAELEGQRGQYVATIAQSGAAMGETRLQILEAEKTYQERTTSELREVEVTLNDLLPKLNAARDQLARTEIRSPATGTVVGLSVFTAGGVIAPGQKLMEIVPDKASLVIEARVSPADADDLAVGQASLVKFVGLHENSLPDLNGKITRVSADSFVDEKSGESYFTADVVVPREELQLIQDVRGRSFSFRAGMPAQVMIPLRKRTALQYAFEPLTEGLRKSFGEQ
jgi:HlyD family secretion protein